MLTSKQEKWVAHLSDEDTITIYPYDSCAEEKYQKVKRQIQKILGDGIRVEHRGASSLGISGQKELDIYIPISLDKFVLFSELLANVFGKPRSVYPFERIRFTTSVEETRADIFLMNEIGKEWLDGLAFEKYLKRNPEALEAYRKLKEAGNGLSVREYYRRKVEFINSILKKHR